MHCEWKSKLRSHNTSYCLIQVVTKAGLTVYWKFIKFRGYCFRAFMKEMHSKNKYHTVETVPITNTKIVERDKIYTPNIQLLDCSFWRESIPPNIQIHDRLKLVFGPKPPPLVK